MRILSVSHFFEAHGGGIERVAGHLSRRLAQLGAASAWAASDCDPAPQGEVRAVPLGCLNPLERLTGLPMPIPGLTALRKLAEEVRRSDVIIVHDALYVTSIVSVLLAYIYQKPVLLIQHIASIPFRSGVLRAVMKLANLMVTRPVLWAATKRIFISDTVRHELLGTPAQLDYELLFNGVDSDLFSLGRSQTDYSLTLSSHSATSSKKSILFVGRYVEKKGLSILRALAQLRPDLQFFLAGSGPICPRDWQLKNVRDLGSQSPQDLAKLYRTADLLLLPSVGEGYPLVIQEAMACGLPVICGEPTNRSDPAMSRWMQGVFVSLSDPQGSALNCSNAIDALCLTLAQREEMARETGERYNWESMAREMMKLATETTKTKSF